MRFNEEDMQAALADLATQDDPNYSATALKYKVERTTLARRHKNRTVSNQEATSIYRKKLTDGQEQVLLREINRLTNDGYPPKPKTVAGLAAGICGTEIGEHWVTRFCARYEGQIKSLYLKPIDRKRQIADNPDSLKRWYIIVWGFLVFTPCFDSR